MATWYAPGARPSNANAPWSSVRVVRCVAFAAESVTSNWVNTASPSLGWPSALLSAKTRPWIARVLCAVDCALGVAAFGTTVDVGGSDVGVAVAGSAVGVAGTRVGVGGSGVAVAGTRVGLAAGVA